MGADCKSAGSAFSGSNPLPTTLFFFLSNSHLGWKVGPVSMSNEEIEVAARALKSGALVALPTETVYGLGVDAENSAAVARMYSVKARPTNHPVIVHIGEVSDLNYWAQEIPDYARALAERFWPGPMTLILHRRQAAKDYITGGQDFVGLRIPSHQIALDLIAEFKKLGGHGIAAPSANRFGGVSPTSAEDVREEIGLLLADQDLILDGGISQIGVESTIIDCSGKLPRILRLGAITEAMIREVTPIDLDDNLIEIRASGTLTRHYSPRARVELGRISKIGEGFIALADIPTPTGSIRLATPNSIEEYARCLYSALRRADAEKLAVVAVIPPEGDGLAAAIRDRLVRASASG
jgi:L-threonylcarbamoyladenylate synthase